MVGKSLAHYKILSELGRGGMGIVYKAEDTNLQRTVGIKVLPSSALASEADRTRFYREARAAASLSHPNIAVIHHIGEDTPRADDQDSSDEEGGHPYIVMEYIEGETLSELIEQGPLKLSRTITLGSQIAGALQVAHEEQIVHRDIKSANVMLSKRGEAKVLDFGLAQTAQSTKLTAQGTIVGTIGYMSPEQARGEDVDSRTDIWALGVVLYEMVTGKHPFPGEYQQAIVYSILNTDPEPVTALRTGVPMELERIIGKCLKKDRKSRYQHADDLIADLREVDIADSGTVVSRISEVAQPTGEASPARGKLIGVAVTGVALAAVAAWFFLLRTPDYTISVASFSKITNEESTVWDPTIHPDGDIVTYSRMTDDGSRLVFRSATGGPETLVTETYTGRKRRAEYSPDGTKLLFQGAGASLFLVDAPRGTPTPLFNSQIPFRTPSWSPDGSSIALAITDTLAIFDVSSRTYHSLGILGHSPAWSPDGTELVYAIAATDQLHYGAAGRFSSSSIGITSVDGQRSRILIEDDHQNLSPIWTPDGQKILFTSSRGGGMDVWSVNVKGSPNYQRLSTGNSFFVIELSDDGSRLVASESHVSHQNLYASTFRTGEVVSAYDAVPVTTGEQVTEIVAVSPNEKWIAYGSNIAGDHNVFLVPKGGGEPRQITEHPAPDFPTGWSPDSKQIIFYSYRNGPRNIFAADIDDFSISEIYQSDDQLYFPTMSYNGKHIGYARGVNPWNYEIIRQLDDGTWGEPRLIAEKVHTINAFNPTKELLAYSINNNKDTFIVNYANDPVEIIHHIEQPGIFIPFWSADGESLMYSARGGIYAYELDTRERRKVLEFNGREGGTLTWGADNEFMYSTFVEMTTDIWVLDLVYQ